MKKIPADGDICHYLSKQKTKRWSAGRELGSGIVNVGESAMVQEWSAGVECRSGSERTAQSVEREVESGKVSMGESAMAVQEWNI